MEEVRGGKRHRREHVNPSIQCMRQKETIRTRLIYTAKGDYACFTGWQSGVDIPHVPPRITWAKVIGVCFADWNLSRVTISNPEWRCALLATA